MKRYGASSLLLCMALALIAVACSIKYPGKVFDEKPTGPVNYAERDELINALLQSKTIEDEELALGRLLGWSGHHNYALYGDCVLYDLHCANEDMAVIRFDHVSVYAAMHPGSPIYLVVTYKGDKKSFTHKLLDPDNRYILTLE